MDKKQAHMKIPLSDLQKEAILHGSGPLLVAAGAGSGKTRVLTQRLIHLLESGISADKIIAITFTNKAASEMKSRITQDIRVVKSRHSSNPSNSNNSDTPNISNGALAPQMPFVGTFHSFCAKILREEAKKLGRDSNFVIFDSNDSKKIVRDLAKEMDLSGDKKTVPKLRKSISRIKNKLLDIKESDEKTRALYEAYEKELKKQNAFDFDDLIEKVVRLFKEHSEILKKYQKKYSYVLVDEYQDINEAQYILLKYLCKEHGNINVVGDDQQSIYGFRWSNFTNFLNFEKDWPEAKIVKLGQNYRSTSNIVNAAASVINNNKLQRPKKLFTENKEGSFVQIVGTKSQEEEADTVIRRLVEGNVENDKAILYRTNAQSRAIEAALNLNSIPYEIFGGITFYERKEIKDIISALRYATNPKDKISRERIEKTFRKSVSGELLDNLPKMAQSLTILELLGYFLKITDYFELIKKKFDNAEERIENISELIYFAGTFDNLSEFIERVSLLQATDKLDKSSEQPIKLMTIHLAKGLEFDEVYLIGASEGLLPHQKSLFSEDDLEEERRLAYVAMTRAKKRLQISFFGFASRFLYEIPSELVEFQGASAPETEIFID